jgi:hypothetical protein
MLLSGHFSFHGEERVSAEVVVAIGINRIVKSGLAIASVGLIGPAEQGMLCFLKSLGS